MDLAERAQDKLEEALNAEGRSRGHVAAGLLVCLGCIAATAAIAAARPQPAAPGAKPSRHPAMRAVWPALFSVTTLAALRVWNAPDSAERTRALGLWVGLQGLSMLWMAWAPRDRTTQVVAAVSTAGLTAAYAHQAAYVDRKAAGLIAPTGFAGLSALIARPAHVP